MKNLPFVAVSALGSVYSKSCPIQLKTAVESLLIGCSSPLEIILVVDGCVPEALGESIDSAADLEVTVIKLPSNLSWASINRRIKHASGDIIVRLIRTMLIFQDV